MSCVSRIVPSLAMNAMESGIFVSFIQKPVFVSCPKTNSIPRSSAKLSRNIRPRLRSAEVRASSTLSSARFPAPSMSVIVAVESVASPSSPPLLSPPPPQATASARRSDRRSASTGRTALPRAGRRGRQPRQPPPLGRRSENVQGQPQRPDHPQEVQVGHLAADQVTEEAPELFAAPHHRHIRRRREVEQLLQLSRHAQLRLKPSVHRPLVGREVVHSPPHPSPRPPPPRPPPRPPGPGARAGPGTRTGRWCPRRLSRAPASKP